MSWCDADTGRAQERLRLRHAQETSRGNHRFSILVMDADGANEKELSKGEGTDLLGGAPMFLLGRGRPPEKP